MPRKITALYIRVSTDSQFEEGYSVDAQKQKLEQWCQLKDINNYEFYIDGGWSGSNIDRPRIKDLIQDISNNKIESVVVYKLDRLSRSQKDTVFLLEDIFNPNGVNFISLNENFDTTTPYGKAMIGILSVFAQLERENIRERTRMGMYERIKSGLWMGGGRVPFGYDYDSEKNILVPNEKAEQVKAIYSLYLQGYSTTRLAKMFDVASDRHITQILDRITYLGKIPYNGEIIEGQHEAIIDEETWEKVQIARKERSNKNVTHSNYLLTGLLYCGKCGAKMRYQKWGKTTKVYCYSQQASRPNLIKDPDCDNLRYDSETLEAIILEDIFAATERAISDGSKSIVYKSDGLEIMQQRHGLLATKIKRLFNLYAEDGNKLLLETIKENQDELNSLAEKINHILMANKVATEINNKNRAIKDLENLRENWDGLTIDKKHAALRICVDKIIVTDGAIDIKYNF